jgi:hypothetical protein
MRKLSAYAGFIAFFSKVLPHNRRIFLAFYIPESGSFWPKAAIRKRWNI